MRLINEHTAEEYLRATGRIPVDETIRVTPLAGGVSNVVLLVARSSGASFVLKQAREQLRVAEPWFCSVERIWREVETLRVCERVCCGDSRSSNSGEFTLCTPRLLFEDRDNYCYAMSAAPPHTVWKQMLLTGRVDAQIAAACGRFLGQLHGRTWRDAGLAAELGDRRFFEDLRVDPYYRSAKRRHADLHEQFDALIDSVAGAQLALVHGDFSPKNLLVYESGAMLVDFEVGHFGDPAFDLGFFTSHLVLKAVHAHSDAASFLQLVAAFQAAYDEILQQSVATAECNGLYARGVLNLAGCALARVDGKSPVEYLTGQQQETARGVARWLLCERPLWHELTDCLARQLDSSASAGNRE